MPSNLPTLNSPADVEMRKRAYDLLVQSPETPYEKVEAITGCPSNRLLSYMTWNNLPNPKHSLPHSQVRTSQGTPRWCRVERRRGR